MVYRSFFALYLKMGKIGRRDMLRITFVILRCLFIVPFWFYGIWKRGRTDSKYTEEERYGYLRNVVKRVNAAARVHIKVEGLEHLPRENGFILFPNHQGTFDMLAIIESCPQPLGVVIKKEAASWILVKQVIELLRGIPIDRSDVKSSLKIMGQITEEVKEGRNYVIFAEGTRSKKGNDILVFKAGSFKSAVNAKCPIIPVALIDSFKPFDISSLREETVQVHYLEAINPEQYMEMKTKEIAHLVGTKIEEKIREKTG